MFTTTTSAELHTATLQAFGDAHERFKTALTFDDVRPHLRAVGGHASVSDDELNATLKALTGWGLLDMVQNYAANYVTAEEYERKNLQYSLTKRGEAAFEGLQRALTVLASTGALQTAVLEAIADRLDELYGYQLDEESSDRRVFTAQTELESHLEALRSNTQQFNAELQRLLRDDLTDVETFHEVKRATIGYLEEFVTNLDVPPLVCTSGWPSSATILLLRRLRDAGAELRYHGDFDGSGIRIAAYVCAKTGAVPWRMSHADYVEAVRPTGRKPGRVTDAPWDPQLASALRHHDVAVPEEQVAAQLLADLQDDNASRLTAE